MKQIILGTAGHIDHGKTALIKALTGIDTDRLKEEKERGITIELGFAHLTLPGGLTIGIVDVPGHEKFVKNMAAGATGIDLVALIIAADEGVMPQTREHLEICSLLDIKHGLVIITKIDLVDKEWLNLARDDVSSFIAGTFLQDSPIVEVSSKTGEGIKDLIKILGEYTEKVPEREPGNFFRLPIDRVFTMRGFGTVVTGTTISGHIKTGSEVTIYPKRIKGKIRGIQVHHQDVPSVRSGLRTAINLQGIEKDALVRGDVVAEKDSLKPTYMVDAFLKYLESNPKKLQNRAKVRFHCGTSEIIATIILLNRNELSPGDQCFAQFRLERPTVVLKKDRFVIRSYSPIRTIGGGYILNPLPSKKKRFSKNASQELTILNEGSNEDIVEQYIKNSRLQGVSKTELSFLANLNKKDLDKIITTLLSNNVIFQADIEKEIFIHAEFYNRAKEDTVAILSDYHRRFPLKGGLVKEELRYKIKGNVKEKPFNQLLTALIQDGAIVRNKDLIRLKDHTVTLLQDQETVRNQIEQIYLKEGLEPPYFNNLDQNIIQKGGKDLLEIMVKDGTLIKVKEDLYFHKESIEELKRRLIAFIKEKGEITTSELKQVTGVSRKYTIPLIEYFDKTQLTVRVGNKRVLRKRQ
ncbi:MAG: selenocysteine-specific translation elongation factor [Deltaproteobacteria bacterium]|nr:MAG: selenocysteine-specific translation elongation factor [Deltaproteobacteria bacterium]